MLCAVLRMALVPDHRDGEGGEHHRDRQMLVMGPVVGLVSGCVFGLFAFVASRFIKTSPAAAPPQT
jgi:hypothetical protein